MGVEVGAEKHDNLVNEDRACRFSIFLIADFAQVSERPTRSFSEDTPRC